MAMSRHHDRFTEPFNVMNEFDERRHVLPSRDHVARLEVLGRDDFLEGSARVRSCGVARTDRAHCPRVEENTGGSAAAALRGARKSAVASTAIHAMNVAMLMRSHTPTHSVGKSA